ncbi:hypothetical protein MMC19_006742 [Ptychographa xylographoides]|nr:hypothetical protein [Ptychographa xylographoides]
MEPSSNPVRRKSPPTRSVASSANASRTAARRAPSLRSPVLPTRLEGVLLAIYPATLLLGSLFSLLNPRSRNAPYSARLQSHPPADAPSYFALKKNLFNAWFVKIGWFWTTLAFFLFLFMHPSTGPRLSPVLTPRRLQGLVRYAVATLWWVLVTQWFFGPGLVDRTYKLTGGQCELVRSEAGRASIGGAREVFTAAACRLAGGEWKGGHDISGHVFLLVLGSAFLWFEILPVVMRHAGLREERLVMHADGSVKSAEAEVQMVGGKDEADGEEVAQGVSAPVVVAGLSWWMLLMTAAYFHTWFEKFTGLVVAFLGVFTIYFLPRAVPAVRRVVGIPGV